METASEKSEILESVQDLAETLQTFATHVDESLAGIRSEMATKSDLARLENKLESAKSEMITHLDGFVKLYKDMDVELLTVRARCDRIEEFDAKVADKIGIEYIPF